MVAAIGVVAIWYFAPGACTVAASRACLCTQLRHVSRPMLGMCAVCDSGRVGFCVFAGIVALHLLWLSLLGLRPPVAGDGCVFASMSVWLFIVCSFVPCRMASRTSASSAHGCQAIAGLVVWLLAYGATQRLFEGPTLHGWDLCSDWLAAAHSGCSFIVSHVLALNLVFGSLNFPFSAEHF